jgi:hypothetical protein
MGLSSTHIKDPARRDRLLMLAAFAQGLLTLLGAANAACGFDRYLKANTVKKRTPRFRNDELATPPVPSRYRTRTRCARTARQMRLCESALT